jgi:hypothetical protein
MSNIKLQFPSRMAMGLLVAVAVALAVAYQTRAPIILEMGSASEDVYLTSGFYPPENAFDVLYRWTNGNAQIHLPGLGSGVPLHLRMSLHEFRPPPLAPNPVTISLNGHEAERFTPGMDLAAYDVDLPAAAMDLRGDATLGLKSDTFVPKQTMGTNDERALGLFVDQIKLTYGPGIIIPPLMVWMLLVVSVVLSYALARLIGLALQLSLAGGAVLLVAQVIAIVTARMWTARNSIWLALTLISLYLIALRLKSGQRSAVSGQPSVIYGLKFELPFVLAVFIVWRIGLMLVPILGVDVIGTTECCPPIDATPLTSVWQAPFERWFRWDAIWYGSIAQDGYQYAGTREPSNAGFFPLFPLASGAAHRLTGLPVSVSGPLVSTLAAFIGCWLLYRITRRETDDPEAAGRSAVYLLAYPGAFYLAIGYTEALYMLCGLAAFWWAREERWGRTGVASFLAGLTRLHGPLLVVPLAYEYMRQRNFRLRAIRADVIGVTGGAFGVLVFMGYLGLRFGEPMAYFQVQGLFFNRKMAAGAFPSFPGTTLANYLTGFVTNPPSTEGTIEIVILILFLILTLEAWVRLPRMYGVYMLTMSLFVLTSGDLNGLPRYSTPVFPMFMALGLMGRRPWVERAILILMILAQGILALMFSNGYWIA